MASSCLSITCVKTIVKGKKVGIMMKCPHYEPDLRKNSFCRGKLILKLSLLNNRGVIAGVLFQGTRYLTKYDTSVLTPLIDYSARISNLRKSLLNFNFKRKSLRCLHLGLCTPNCRIFNEYLVYQKCFAFLNELGLAYRDPFAFYALISSLIKDHNSLKVHKQYEKCFHALTSLLNKSYYEIDDSMLITKFKEHYRQLGDKIYEALFRPSYVIEKAGSLGQQVVSSPIKEYLVDVFRVKIFKLNTWEHTYFVSLDLPYTVKYLHLLLRDNIDISNLLSDIIKKGCLWEKICFLRDEYEEKLKTLKFEVPGYLSSDFLQKTASYLAYRTLGIHKIMPFLLDSYIDEVYLDKPQSRVYLDHSEFGRCTSNILLTNDDVNRFITHIKVESRMPLNYLNPSLKWNMRINEYTVRVSIDIPPLSFEGPSLNLRKIRHKIFTIVDLIKAGTLSLEEAAFVILHILNRRNIIICGEPGSGKTTFMNALDFCTPKNWRKVYIEDIVESWDQRPQGRHQLRLHVEPYETKKRLRRKSSEIIKLLHRSPDWVCMGELQTKEHFKALFHALTAGLRGIHTCHASSLEGLIKRWVLHYSISKEDVFEVDLVIHMLRCYKGVKVVRRVNEIWSVGMPQEGNFVDIIGIPLTLVFKWDAQRDIHECRCPELFKTPSVIRIANLGISLSMLKEEYEEIKSFLQRVLTGGSMSLENFIQAFDNLACSLLRKGAYAF